MTGQNMTSYPILEPKQLKWDRTADEPVTTLSERSPMLVRDGVVLIGWPKEFVGQMTPAAHLELYSRQTVEDSREVGMLAEDIEIARHGTGRLTDRFQCAEGGIYYYGSDGVLVFLAGKPK